MTQTDRAGAHPLDDLALKARHQILDGRPLLQGRTIVLTGAAGGIGRSIAEALVCAGATLAASDIDVRSLDDLMGDVDADADRRSFARVMDATDFGAFAAFVSETIDRLGAVDGLVNCAGQWASAPHADVDPEMWRRMLELNLSTAFAGCQAVLPHMKERGAGSIVNFSSTAGEYGSISPGSHYAAAKGGVIALTKSLAREVGGFNVRVNAISPGPTDTVALGADTEEKRRTAGARTLFGRLGRPEEIAYGCVFLLSDLSTFMTGQLLGMNGGSRL